MPSDNPERLEQRAKNILLHQLSRSMKTRHQLAQILQKREIPEEIALAVLDRFEQAQLIDDRVFAQAFVRSKLEAGKAASVIRRELRNRGVAQNLIEWATAEITSEAEQQLANRLAQQRLARISNLERSVIERRLLGYLQRRGFAGQVAYQAVRKATTPR